MKEEFFVFYDICRFEYSISSLVRTCNGKLDIVDSITIEPEAYDLPTIEKIIEDKISEWKVKYKIRYIKTIEL